MADKKNGPNGTGSADKKDGMTKWDAVKKTLDDLGWDTMPLAIKDHLKKEHGIEITAHVASNYKKKLKRMAREAVGTQAAASAKKPAAVPQAAKPPRRPPRP